MFKISQEILKIDYRMLSELIFLFNLKEVQRSAKKNAKVFTSRLWTWNFACFFVLLFDMFDRKKWSKKASKMLPFYAILTFFIQLLRQVCSKPGEGYQISLDLFLLVIFLRVRSHGIHHHEKPTIWENMSGTFSKHQRSKSKLWLMAMQCLYFWIPKSDGCVLCFEKKNYMKSFRC